MIVRALLPSLMQSDAVNEPCQFIEYEGENLKRQPFTTTRSLNILQIKVTDIHACVKETILN